MDSDDVAAELGVRRTLAAYCQLLDSGRFEEWSEVFAPDARMHVMGSTLDGRQAIRDFIEPTQPAEARGCHLMSEPLVDIAPDHRSATATTDYAFVARDLSVMSSGRYHDRLHRTDDGWQLTHREIVFLGEEPVGFD